MRRVIFTMDFSEIFENPAASTILLLPDNEPGAFSPQTMEWLHENTAGKVWVAADTTSYSSNRYLDGYKAIIKDMPTLFVMYLAFESSDDALYTKLCWPLPINHSGVMMKP